MEMKQPNGNETTQWNFKHMEMKQPNGNESTQWKKKWLERIHSDSFDEYVSKKLNLLI